MKRSFVVPFILVAAIVVGIVLTRRTRPPLAPPPENPAVEPAPAEPKLALDDLTVGSGALAQDGSRVSIHYTGWVNGAKFDSSLARAPLTFQLGRHEVLRGWEEGMVGMKVGGKRRLTVPPSLGYGKTGSPGGAIPPMSTLVFEIELLEATTP